jgi:hypothetical protein
VRAAALAGLGAGGALAGLGGVAAPAADPRLSPREQTARKLTALRAEAEKALAAEKP